MATSASSKERKYASAKNEIRREASASVARATLHTSYLLSRNPRFLDISKEHVGIIEKYIQRMTAEASQRVIKSNLHILIFPLGPDEECSACVVNCPGLKFSVAGKKDDSERVYHWPREPGVVENYEEKVPDSFSKPETWCAFITMVEGCISGDVWEALVKIRWEVEKGDPSTWAKHK